MTQAMFPKPSHSRHRHIRGSRPQTAEAAPLRQHSRIVVVVTCKGRLNHLRITAPVVLSQLPPQGRLMVVDYGDPDGAFEFCRCIDDPRVVALKVLDDTDIFNLSRARNCGANLIASDVLVFVDADALLHPDFLSEATYPITTRKAVLTRRNLRDCNVHTCGICCVSTEIYHRIRGYDESFCGWGPEDCDFYERVGRHGQVHHFPAHLCPTTLSHSDADRTRFYPIKNRHESAEQSGLLMKHPDRPINIDGYGRALAEAWGLTHKRETVQVSVSEQMSGLCTPENEQDCHVS